MLGKKKKTRHLSYIRCPICNKYDHVGDNGYGRYFCADCCVQFRIVYSKDKTKKRTSIYSSDEEGKEIFIDEYEEVL